MQRPLWMLTVSTLVACGDSTVTSVTADGSSATATPMTGPPTLPTTSESASDSEGTTAGSVSESTESSSTGEPGAASSTTDASATGTTDSTTAGVESCEPGLAPARPIAIDPACEGMEIKDIMDPWNFNLEWYHEEVGMGVIVMPAVGLLTDDDGDGDVDDDDIPAIVYSTFGNNTLTALHGDGSGVAFKIGNINGNGGPAIADVDGDGAPEVLAFRDNSAIVLDGTGQVQWTSPALAGLSAYPQVTAADLDEDGDVEVIADNSILDGKTGALIATLPVEVGHRTPVVADLDLDGKKEILLYRSVFSSTGALLWTVPGSGGAAFASVANIDDDPEAEVFINYYDTLFVRQHDGSALGQHLIPGNIVLSGPTCMADFDGNGDIEIAVPASTQLNMMNADGTLVWQSPITDLSGAAGCSGYDVNGDGIYEVLFADEHDLRVYDGPTGTVLYTNSAHSSGTLWEYPVVADVDKDGSAEIIVAANGVQHGLSVFGHAGDGWSVAGYAWPVHDYAVTNIAADGSVPQSPEPSWQAHNIFRARPTVDDPALPDLLVEITDTCIACGSPAAHVAYQVCNQGDVDVDAGMPLTLFALDMAAEVVVKTRILPAVPAGTCLVGDSFVFDPAALVDGQVVLRLYDNGTGTGPVVECNQSNDQTTAELMSCASAPN